MRFRSIALTSATTIVVVLLVLNLTLGDKHVDKPIARLYRLDDPQFTRTMGAMLGPAILAGNRVTTLVNGVEIFPSMLEAIRGARRSITLETYIYWSGCIGRNFAEALAERARSGVKVLVLIDAIGSGEIEGAYMRDMAVLFRSTRANYAFHDAERGWPADEKPVRSDLYFQSWILALLGAIAVLGFVLGILAYISVFLRLNAGVRWARAVAGGVGASAVLIGLGDALVLHYPGGLLQALFDLPWPFD